MENPDQSYFCEPGYPTHSSTGPELADGATRG